LFGGALELDGHVLCDIPAVTRTTRRRRRRRRKKKRKKRK